MKLNVDLTALWARVDEMGAEHAEFDIEVQSKDSLNIDVELERGREITLEDLETNGGLLSAYGRQVLLYIADQGGNLQQVLDDPSRGRRYHVADCKTLQSMRQRNRFDRYHVTNNMSGDFRVFGSQDWSGKAQEGFARLHICQNCLGYLNYQGYRTEPRQKTTIRDNFSLEQFFARYSTMFRYLPKAFAAQPAGYTEDWKEVSRRYRRARGYRCERCRVDLSDYKHLLHTHHINGVKHDNSESNLRALCLDCHRKEPLHQRMQVRAEQMQQLHHCRREQGLLDDGNWNEILELADTAFDGLLRIYRDANRAVPEIGYELQNDSHEVVATIEVAWPLLKEGVIRDDEETELFEALGWQVIKLGVALREVSR